MNEEQARRLNDCATPVIGRCPLCGGAAELYYVDYDGLKIDRDWCIENTDFCRDVKCGHSCEDECPDCDDLAILWLFSPDKHNPGFINLDHCADYAVIECCDVDCGCSVSSGVNPNHTAGELRRDVLRRWNIRIR